MSACWNPAVPFGAATRRMRARTPSSPQPTSGCVERRIEHFANAFAKEPGMNDWNTNSVISDPRHDATRVIRAPRGSDKTCKSWITEAAYRMIQNNLDAEVAEDPRNLVVYGGIGRAARNWACYDKILEMLR